MRFVSRYAVVEARQPHETVLPQLRRHEVGELPRPPEIRREPISF